MTEASAIHHLAPGKVAVRPAPLRALEHDCVLIRTLWSAVSGGTESMIYRGRFPPGGPQDSTIASLQGDFTYPFRYGYALVGEVIDVGAEVDTTWRGRQVFAFHPHQDLAVVPLRDVVAIPPYIAPRAALFFANMESALNFILDASPNTGERVMVLGLGVVGLLTTALLAEFPLSLLIGADPLASRRERALVHGAGRAIDPGNSGAWRALERELFGEGEPAGLDLAFELSGSMRALEHAIEMTGFSGRVIVGSWYGSAVEPLDLGSHFHRRRIELVSSQVSTVHPRLTGRWTKRRRQSLAWDAIARLQPERLITHSFSLHDCERAFDLVSSRSDDVLQVVFEYL
jgi:2-desacetyl-2-hydroxyethyl bacteriochlorophyllide A dehydrogenase